MNSYPEISLRRKWPFTSYKFSEDALWDNCSSYVSDTTELLESSPSFVTASHPPLIREVLVVFCVEFYFPTKEHFPIYLRNDDGDVLLLYKTTPLTDTTLRAYPNHDMLYGEYQTGDN